MSQFKSVRKNFERAMFFAFALLITFSLSSCKEDEPEKPIGAVPTVTVSTASLSALPGGSVTATVNVNAPEGGSQLRILVNGAPNAAFPNVPMNGETTFSYTLNYTVPTSVAPGTVVNFSFIATDILNRPSTDIAVVGVTVDAIPPKPIVEVSGTITANTTWTKDKIYLLKGFVRVGSDLNLNTIPAANSGPTLTIQPGTVIMGERASKATLVIQRGAKIIANGTAAEPIIMTSAQPVNQREPGDWGGLVVCGLAPNNQPGGVFELEGGYAAYSGGGTSPVENDNSGIIKYVRIEYAGVPINPNQEVNTLTMGAVGSGTVIEYVQASFGLDDAFEWFGGTVNGKYLLAYKCLDDDFDVDFGYSGLVQFGVGIRDNNLADQSGSNGFEVDNNGQGLLVAPYTSGRFSNMTIIGPKSDREKPISLQFQNGAHLRRSNKLKIHNSIFVGYPVGIFIDGAATSTFATNDELTIRNTVVAGVFHWGGNGFGGAGDVFTGAPSNGAQHPNTPRGTAFQQNQSTFNTRDWFLAAERNNQFVPDWTTLGLSPTIFATVNPSFPLQSGSPLASGASFAGMPSFFQVVPFRGAFGAQDWTAQWTEFQPNIIDYSR